MYYDQEFVDSLIDRMKVPGGEPYVRSAAVNVGNLLMKDSMIYKSFGVYWWAMKHALRSYYPDKTAWFMGPYQDYLMEERAWHRDLFRTVLAGLYYHGKQITHSSDHSWIDGNGVEHDYTLFDENAGF